MKLSLISLITLISINAFSSHDEIFKLSVPEFNKKFDENVAQSLPLMTCNSTEGSLSMIVYIGASGHVPVGMATILENGKVTGRLQMKGQGYRGTYGDAKEVQDFPILAGGGTVNSQTTRIELNKVETTFICDIRPQQDPGM